jgi:hypothetical protein
MDPVQSHPRTSSGHQPLPGQHRPPFLIHRRPDRKKQKQAETKEHWTKIEERYLTRAFKEAREAADCYKGWKEEEMPGFHEVRALSLHLY